MSVESKLTELKTRLREVFDLYRTNAVLSWDQATYMPPGGAAARARQMALISRLAHERFTDPAIGGLLDDLHDYGDALPAEHDDAALVRVTRREYERATCIPAEFVARMYSHIAQTYSTWAEARPRNDFAAVQPLLEQTLAFSREYAGFFPGRAHVADALIEGADYGMTVATIKPLFAELRSRLVPMLEAITARPEPETGFLQRTYPKAQQLAFSETIARQIGYDFARGRQDLTHHPFCTTFSVGDVRITTRVNEQDFGDGLFSTIHESGHAMYEQGVSPDFDGTPLGGGTSAGVHESQSRLWENLVGRSYGFWQHFYPQLQQAFPEQLADVDLDRFYQAINKVERSLIRTDADEMTYNLHVIIRFDLELDLLEGRLAVRDLPEVWRERYRTDIGVASPDDRNGVLQDVHWYSGLIGGAFQGYTLGNIMSAQIYDAALRSHPDIPEQIRQGQFGTLLHWLQTNIYAHGSKFDSDTIMRRATGAPLSLEPYLHYLQTKYGALYQLTEGA